MIVPILMNCAHKPSTLRAHFGDVKEQYPVTSRSKRALVQQFQQIKRQIQQFQDKNEAIIHRIRQVYNFRKKQPILQCSSQISLSKDQSNPNNSVNGMDSPSEKLVCLPVTYKPFKKSEKNSGGYHQTPFFTKAQPCNTLAMSAVYEYNTSIPHNKQCQPQFQQYSIKLHHQPAQAQQKRRYSESKVRNQSFNVFQETPTQQSQEYEDAQYLYNSSAYSRQIQDQSQHNSIQMKTLMKNVKIMFQNLFFTISEEYFGDKFIELQRHVRRLENTIKRLAQQVRNYDEERKQNRQRAQLGNQSRSLPSSKRTQQLQKQPLNASAVGKHINIQNKQVNLSKQTVDYYQRLVKKLSNHIQNIQLELKSAKIKEEIRKKGLQQQIQQQKKSINQSKLNHQRQMQRVQTEGQSYRQRIKYLESKLSQQIVNNKKLQQYAKSLQGQIRKYDKNYQQIKEASRLECEQSKIKMDKLNKKYQQSLKDAESTSKSLHQIKKKLLEEQVEVYSLTSKLRTLQHQLLVKDNKISALHELLLSDENSHEHHSSKHHCNFFTKNSLIKIDFKDSNESFQAESDEHLDRIQLKQSGQIKQQSQTQRESARRLNQDESNELISHNKVLEDKFNQIYREYSGLRERNLELEKENQRIKDDNGRLKEVSKDNLKKYKKTSKQHQILKQEIEQTKQRSLLLEQQLKMSKNQILQASKADNGNSTHNSQKQGILSSLQYSQLTIAQIPRQEQQHLSQLENELQLLMFQQQMQTQPQDQRLIQAEKELIQKDEQLEMYLQEIDELKAELELVKSELKSSREDKRYGQEERYHTIEPKCSRLDSIEPKEDCGYRQSISFRLSVDPSELVATALADSQGIASIRNQDETLAQKMKQSKNNRRDHIRLFEMTTNYIKQLKGIILEKSIQISLLQNQIKRLNQSQEQKLFLSGTKVKMPKEFKALYGQDIESIHGSCENDHDGNLYRSVELPSKSYPISTGNETQQGKQLLLQQNKILLREIQILQEELSRSQEQESSLIKIKDFYKEEVKRQQDLFHKKIQEKEGEIKLIVQTGEQDKMQLKDAVIKIGSALSEFVTRTSDNSCPAANMDQITQCYQKAFGLLKIPKISALLAQQ